VAPTNRNRIEGLRGRATRQWTGTPESHPDVRAGKSGGDHEKETGLTLGDLRGCPGDSGLPVQQWAGMGSEESAEAIVGRGSASMRLDPAPADEGPNFFGAGSRPDDSE
jgi:hypothetical protein